MLKEILCLVCLKEPVKLICAITVDVIYAIPGISPEGNEGHCSQVLCPL
jgi:hypothetical protein